jgi:hypothetical protein
MAALARTPGLASVLRQGERQLPVAHAALLLVPDAILFAKTLDGDDGVAHRSKANKLTFSKAGTLTW